MATMTSGRPRRGLPRVPGGQPWPPVSEIEPAPGVEGSQAAGAVVADPRIATVERAGDPPAPVRGSQAAGAAVADPRIATVERAGDVPATPTVRRGLPRVPGGEPWPPVVESAAPPPAAQHAGVPVSQVADAGAQHSASATHERAASVDADAPVSPVAGAAAPDRADVTLERADAGAGRTLRHVLRRGLPRVPGGEAWPPAGWVAANQAETGAPVSLVADAEAHNHAQVTPEPAMAVAAPGAPEPAPRVKAAAPAAPPAKAPAPAALRDVSAPLQFPQTVYPGAAALEYTAKRAAAASVAPRAEAKRYGPFTALQWTGAVILGGAGMLVAAAFAVLAARWLLSLEFMRDFLTAYPGEYPLPGSAPVGIPSWLGWQHFFNVFLIVLIIRTGITVHNEKRPSAFWSPRRNSKRKISLTLWFHQSLDILWLVNGVTYVVLLFATAQWMRLVPTSWAVFPNALSAGLQYVSLNWPTENGWVNYNSLQQLAYFATVFIAAPLATITGVRMSGVWPRNAQTLNRLYPLEWARKLHFPVMVYFVAFIIVHVALVFATNALRNLNHMYGGQDAVNWTGFWIFVASMVVVAAGWIAARPLVLAPIARLFGTVSAR